MQSWEGEPCIYITYKKRKATAISQIDLKRKAIIGCIILIYF